MNTELIDYNKCQEYARSLCGVFGIPSCDVGDVGGDAFLLAIRRCWHTELKPDDNPQTVANRLMYTSVLNVIDRRNNKSFLVLSDAEGLYRNDCGDDSPSDDEIVEERFAACDKQQAEERITEYLDWQYPFWMRLFDSERQKLRNEKKKLELRLIRLGLKDTRLSIVCENMKISWSRFQTILNNFKARFDLCFRALCAWRA